MKYVIFQYRKVFMPVIVPEHVTHRQIKIAGAIPISAGFFRIGVLGQAIVYGKSESLNMKPDIKRDERLLNNVLNGVGTSAYSD